MAPGKRRIVILVGAGSVVAFLFLLGFLSLRREDEIGLRLNEVAFDGLGPDLGSEWAELYNAGDPIDVGGFTLVNGRGAVIATLPPIEMPHDSYLVVRFGPGVPDLDFSDGIATFFAGGIGEVLDNDNDELGIYRGDAANLGRVIDLIAYDFTSRARPGKPQTDAASGDGWVLGQFFTDAIFLAEGSSIGRDFKSTDTNRPEDWFGDGGLDAVGVTPGAANIDPDVAYLIQVGENVRCTRPAQRDRDEMRKALEEALKDLKANHLSHFMPADLLDPGLKAWDGKTFTRSEGNEVAFDNLVVKLCAGLSSQGDRNLGGLAPAPRGSDTPSDTWIVFIDTQDVFGKVAQEQRLLDILIPTS